MKKWKKIKGKKNVTGVQDLKGLAPNAFNYEKKKVKTKRRRKRRKMCFICLFFQAKAKSRLRLMNSLTQKIKNKRKNINNKEI